MRTLRFSLLLATLTAMLAGCKTGPRFDARPPLMAEAGSSVVITNQLDPALLKPSEALYTLGPGDTVEVEIVGDAASRVVLAVGPDGRVYFNILPGVEIWGLTLMEARTRLETELKKYVSQPTVNISLRNASSKHLWMLGRVGRPGLYPMAGPTTLLEALALAGIESYRATGTTAKTADLQRSFVMRQGQLVPVDFRAVLEGDMSQNIYLQQDDFVFVASAQAEEVYVLGSGVASARALPFKEDMTLVSAISAAGGTIPDAYDTHVVIVRGSLTTPQIDIVDFRAIRKGLSKDVRLQPRDIVFVPWQPWRDLKLLVKQLTTTFVTTIAANEGSRLVDPNADALGISVNPGSTGGGSGGSGGGGGGSGGGGK